MNLMKNWIYELSWVDGWTGAGSASESNGELNTMHR